MGCNPVRQSAKVTSCLFAVDFILLNEIVIPRNSLVVLCGPAGSGKSTWAAKQFSPTQVVSSDECRALVVDDPANQEVSDHAFELFHFIITKRLALGRLTVADATNLRREHRRTLIQIARRFHFNTVAIVFDVPVETCLSRNAERLRKIPQDALINQRLLLDKTLKAIDREGFTQVYSLNENTQSNTLVRIGRFVSRRSPRPAL
jgi:protein phosphatase